MNWRDRIGADPDVLVGKAVIKGTRISVELVMDLLARGYSREDVLRQYPTLTAEDITACLGYAAELTRLERMLGRPARFMLRNLANENVPGPVSATLPEREHDGAWILDARCRRSHALARAQQQRLLW